jgi:hypothetical protein
VPMRAHSQPSDARPRKSRPPLHDLRAAIAGEGQRRLGIEWRDQIARRLTRCGTGGPCPESSGIGRQRTLRRRRRSQRRRRRRYGRRCGSRSHRDRRRWTLLVQRVPPVGWRQTTVARAHPSRSRRLRQRRHGSMIDPGVVPPLHQPMIPSSAHLLNATRRSAASRTRTIRAQASRR